MDIKVNQVNEPSFVDVTVKAKLPTRLQRLNELAHNLLWVWNLDVKNLFERIDEQLWHKVLHNPIAMLEQVPLQRWLKLEIDNEFLSELDRVYNIYKEYLNAPCRNDAPSVAYFSMEYGLTDHLKIYSGGLGVLAGDYLKEASDSRVDMVGIGFLYRYGYFTQTLSVDGQQIANYEPQLFSHLPIEQVKNNDGSALIVEVPYPNRTVFAQVWVAKVGRVPLYLLDTDFDMNSPEDRFITHQLYGGDWENRIKQEILLGIGGVRTLRKLGLEKKIYHCNEGHAALLNVERLREYVAKGLTFYQAMELVSASSLYTCHTPVPAGHDSFDEHLFGKYMGAYPQQLGIEWRDFMNLGRETPDTDQKFSMSVFACNTCSGVNGVSYLHGKVSQKMFAPIWRGYLPDELHVSYVTNGVHLPTWATSQWRKLYEKYFGADFYRTQSDLKTFSAIYDVPDEYIWSTRMAMKNKLIAYIKEQFTQTWLKSQNDPSKIMSILERITPNSLIIGFGRRFATYKRAHLLFTDLARLEKIVNNPERPVQFLFTGKAHPADGGGQALIKRIIEISRMPQFVGKIIFLENYDMRLSKRLISGVDVWLNTPTRPLEASGTSGEKAQMNGVLNLSVLDGWWYEGYVKGAGWSLTDKRTYENQAFQDQLDAATIYSLIENEIAPLYYDRNESGYSPKWVATIKKSIAEITPRFTMKRMIDDYITRFYVPMATRTDIIADNDCAAAKELVDWKLNMARNWDNIEVGDVTWTPINDRFDNSVGDKSLFAVDVNTNGVVDNGLGVELVVIEKTPAGEEILRKVKEFDLVGAENNVLHFELRSQIEKSGQMKVGVRLFPKHPLLPHRMAFCYVRWLNIKVQ